MNEVTNFMWYIFNKWTKEECEYLFGYLAEHIWNKWKVYNHDALRWYAELDNECRQKLVDRANEIYSR